MRTITIGTVEDIILMHGNVKLPARIDTGASMSSLDVREFTVKGNEVWFRLPSEYGGLRWRLPLIDWRYFRSSEGRERRPVVKLELCLGNRRFSTLVNLNDRSHLTYPLLIGRQALEGHYVVDVSQAHTAMPHCTKAARQ